MTMVECLTKVRVRSYISYSLAHPASGEWGSLYWENESGDRPHWYLATSDDAGSWSQKFFVKPEDLPDVIEILFREGWTWKR